MAVHAYNCSNVINNHNNNNNDNNNNCNRELDNYCGVVVLIASAFGCGKYYVVFF